MDYDIAMEWVANLRSGEFKQGKGCLFDGKSYCCLGVLAKQLGAEFEPVNDGGSAYVVRGTNERMVLPISFVKAAGMSEAYGGVRSKDGGTVFELSALNDRDFTFEQIAYLIETNWERL